MGVQVGGDQHKPGEGASFHLPCPNSTEQTLQGQGAALRQLLGVSNSHNPTPCCLSTLLQRAEALLFPLQQPMRSSGVTSIPSPPSQHLQKCPHREANCAPFSPHF